MFHNGLDACNAIQFDVDIPHNGFSMPIFPNPMKSQLIARSLDEITQIALSIGLKRFAGAQIADWIFKKRTAEIDQITNLSKFAREALAENFMVGQPQIVDIQTSTDGTQKYLFKNAEGLVFEAVYIPSETSRTLCISSQAGCRMGCTFCMTGRMGFKGNLSAGDIVGQVLAVNQSDKLTNVVLMGMGEPLDNWVAVERALEIMTAPWGLAWSPTRITLSSIGVHKTLEHFLQNTKINLAISLHNPFSDQRAAMMPSENAFPIAQTIKMVEQYDFAHQRRVSFEYIVFAGVNDSEHHIKAIVALLGGLKRFCRINLIRFHRIEGSDLPYTTNESINKMNAALNKAGIITTTRTSRGEDILAACGMLANSQL